MSDPTASGTLVEDKDLRDLPELPAAVKTLLPDDSKRLKAKYPDLWADPQKSCPTCAKKGTFRTRYGTTIYNFRCDCVAQWKLNRFLLNANIGAAYQRLVWEDAQALTEKSLDQALSYTGPLWESYAANGCGLILWSESTGTGKTMLATLLLKMLLSQGADGYFCQFNELLDSYTAGWRDTEQRDWFTRRVQNAGVLVIDDIGKENQNRGNTVDSLLDQVVRHRVANAKPTIITTNLRPDEMSERYYQGLLSLLAESALTVHIRTSFGEGDTQDYRSTVNALRLADVQDNRVRPFSLGGGIDG